MYSQVTTLIEDDTNANDTSGDSGNGGGAPFNIAAAAQLTNRLAHADTDGGPTDRPRERILEAARVALLRDGYEKITTRRIAEEARVNIATLHYHYGSKEALLSAAVGVTLENSAQTLRAAMEGEPDMGSALRAVFALTLDLIKGRFGILRYDLATRGLRDANARRDANAIYDTFRALVTDAVARHYGPVTILPTGVPVADFAQYVVAAVDGIVLQHVLSGDDDAASRSLSLLHDHALQLLERAPKQD